MNRKCECGSQRLRYTSDDVYVWDGEEAPPGCEIDTVRIPGWRCQDCLQFTMDKEELQRVRRARRIALARKAANR